MSFPFALVVFDSDLREIRDVHVHLSALGAEHELELARDGDQGMQGQLTLPAAPRFMRIEADCTTSMGTEPCLDELWFPPSTDGAVLELQLVREDGHVMLMSADSSGMPVWVGFSWGALLLVAGLVGITWSRSHA